MGFGPATFRISPQGVENVAWPVGLAELQRFRDGMAAELVDLLDSAWRASPRDAELVWLSFSPLLLDVLCIFQAASAVERLGGTARTMAEDDDGLFRPLAEGRPPAAPPALEILRRGLANPSLCRRVVRRARAWTGLMPGSGGGNFVRYRKAGLPLTFSTGNRLLHTYAREQDATLSSALYTEWFSAGPAAAGLADGIGAPFVRRVTDVIAAQFEASGTRFGAHLQRRFHDCLDLYGRYVAFYLTELEAQSAQLPADLWSGTMGQPWNRIMAWAVAKNGGSVTVFDHGTGSGILADARAEAIVEYGYLDRFVTFSQPMAAGVREEIAAGRYPGPRRDRIVDVVGPVANPYRLQRPGRPAGTRQPTVLYLPTIYHLGWRMTLEPLPSDVVYADWQARMLSTLKAAGYRVLIKPHPDCAVALPPAFERDLGVESRSGNLTEALHEADVVLFDYKQTTAFVETMAAGKPTVLVNMTKPDFRHEVRALLDDRVAVVDCDVDDDNRIVVDWDALTSAVERAATLTCNRFLSRYYNFT